MKEKKKLIFFGIYLLVVLATLIFFGIDLYTSAPKFIKYTRAFGINSYKIFLEIVVYLPVIAAELEVLLALKYFWLDKQYSRFKSIFNILCPSLVILIMAAFMLSYLITSKAVIDITVYLMVAYIPLRLAYIIYVALTRFKKV